MLIEKDIANSLVLAFKLDQRRENIKVENQKKLAILVTFSILIGQKTDGTSRELINF